MNVKCADCIFANKSGNNEFVYCTYWQNKANESNMNQEDFVRKVLFPSTDLQQVALGWGFPKQHFQLESHWVHKGTASEGLMWNEQILVHKEESCNQFSSIHTKNLHGKGE